jgi:hypothetical protein
MGHAALEFPLKGFSMAETVFILWHSHPTGGNEYNEKLIGVYATEQDALDAQGRTSLKPGFSSCMEGFLIDAYEIGKDHWIEGYFTA